MDRWGWMAVKAYAPAFVGVFVAAVFELVSDRLNANVYLKGMAQLMELPSIAAFVASMWYAAWVTYQLKRWERGKALACTCGGLLGWERTGVRGRGAYRKCLACGTNVNHRHYE